MCGVFYRWQIKQKHKYINILNMNAMRKWYSASSCLNIKLFETEISWEVSLKNMLHLFIYAALSRISAITQSITRPTPLMVWKCFYFIWHSASGLIWPTEKRMMSYVKSRIHWSDFFKPTGNCFSYSFSLFSSKLIYCSSCRSWQKSEMWIRVCGCDHVGLEPLLLQPPTVISPPWALSWVPGAEKSAKVGLAWSAAI